MLEGIICLIISVAFFVYSIFAFNQKGPLLTTMYYIANAEERAKMKTKKEYHFMAKTYLLLSIAVAVMSLGYIFDVKGTTKIAMVILFITVIYTFTVSIKNSINKQK